MPVATTVQKDLQGPHDHALQQLKAIVATWPVAGAGPVLALRDKLLAFSYWCQNHMISTAFKFQQDVQGVLPWFAIASLPEFFSQKPTDATNMLRDLLLIDVRQEILPVLDWLIHCDRTRSRWASDFLAVQDIMGVPLFQKQAEDLSRRLGTVDPFSTGTSAQATQFTRILNEHVASFTDQKNLNHMCEALQKFNRFSSQNPNHRSGLLRLLEILGEAVAHIKPAFKKQFPSIPWIMLNRVRNILEHPRQFRECSVKFLKIESDPTQAEALVKELRVLYSALTSVVTEGINPASYPMPLLATLSAVKIRLWSSEEERTNVESQLQDFNKQSDSGSILDGLIDILQREPKEIPNDVCAKKLLELRVGWSARKAEYFIDRLKLHVFHQKLGPLQIRARLLGYKKEMKQFLLTDIVHALNPPGPNKVHYEAMRGYVRKCLNAKEEIRVEKLGPHIRLYAIPQLKASQIEELKKRLSKLPTDFEDATLNNIVDECIDMCISGEVAYRLELLSGYLTPPQIKGWLTKERLSALKGSASDEIILESVRELVNSAEEATFSESEDLVRKIKLVSGQPALKAIDEFYQTLDSVKLALVDLIRYAPYVQCNFNSFLSLDTSKLPTLLQRAGYLDKNTFCQIPSISKPAAQKIFTALQGCGIVKEQGRLDPETSVGVDLLSTCLKDTKDELISKIAELLKTHQNLARLMKQEDMAQKITSCLDPLHRCSREISRLCSFDVPAAFLAGCTKEGSVKKIQDKIVDTLFDHLKALIPADNRKSAKENLRLPLPDPKKWIKDHRQQLVTPDTFITLFDGAVPMISQSAFHRKLSAFGLTAEHTLQATLQGIFHRFNAADPPAVSNSKAASTVSEIFSVLMGFRSDHPQQDKAFQAQLDAFMSDITGDMIDKMVLRKMVNDLAVDQPLKPWLCDFLKHLEPDSVSKDELKNRLLTRFRRSQQRQIIKNLDRIESKIKQKTDKLRWMSLAGHQVGETLSPVLNLETGLKKLNSKIDNVTSILDHTEKELNQDYISILALERALEQIGLEALDLSYFMAFRNRYNPESISLVTLHYLKALRNEIAHLSAVNQSAKVIYMAKMVSLEMKIDIRNLHKAPSPSTSFNVVSSSYFRYQQLLDHHKALHDLMVTHQIDHLSFLSPTPINPLTPPPVLVAYGPEEDLGAYIEFEKQMQSLFGLPVQILSESQYQTQTENSPSAFPFTLPIKDFFRDLVLHLRVHQNWLNVIEPATPAKQDTRQIEAKSLESDPGFIQYLEQTARNMASTIGEVLAVLKHKHGDEEISSWLSVLAHNFQNQKALSSFFEDRFDALYEQEPGEPIRWRCRDNRGQLITDKSQKTEKMKSRFFNLLNYFPDADSREQFFSSLAQNSKCIQSLFDATVQTGGKWCSSPVYIKKLDSLIGDRTLIPDLVARWELFLSEEIEIDRIRDIIRRYLSEYQEHLFFSLKIFQGVEDFPFWSPEQRDNFFLEDLKARFLSTELKMPFGSCYCNGTAFDWLKDGYQKQQQFKQRNNKFLEEIGSCESLPGWFQEVADQLKKDIIPDYLPKDLGRKEQEHSTERLKLDERLDDCLKDLASQQQKLYRIQHLLAKAFIGDGAFLADHFSNNLLQTQEAISQLESELRDMTSSSLFTEVNDLFLRRYCFDIVYEEFKSKCLEEKTLSTSEVFSECYKTALKIAADSYVTHKRERITGSINIPFTEHILPAQLDLLEQLAKVSTLVLTALGTLGFYDTPQVFGGLIDLRFAILRPLNFIVKTENPVTSNMLFEAEYRLSQLLGCSVGVFTEDTLNDLCGKLLLQEQYELLQEAPLLHDILFLSKLQTYLSDGLLESIILRNGRILYPTDSDFSPNIFPEVLLASCHFSQQAYNQERRIQIQRRKLLLTREVTGHIRHLSDSLLTAIQGALDDIPETVRSSVLRFFEAEKCLDGKIKAYFLDHHSQIAADVIQYSRPKHFLLLYHFQKEIYQTPSELDWHPKLKDVLLLLLPQRTDAFLQLAKAITVSEERHLVFPWQANFNNQLSISYISEDNLRDIMHVYHLFPLLREHIFPGGLPESTTFARRGIYAFSIPSIFEKGLSKLQFQLIQAVRIIKPLTLLFGELTDLPISFTRPRAEIQEHIYEDLVSRFLEPEEQDCRLKIGLQTYQKGSLFDEVLSTMEDVPPQFNFDISTHKFEQVLCVMIYLKRLKPEGIEKYKASMTHQTPALDTIRITDLNQCMKCTCQRTFSIQQVFCDNGKLSSTLSSLDDFFQYFDLTSDLYPLDLEKDNSELVAEFEFNQLARKLACIGTHLQHLSDQLTSTQTYISDRLVPPQLHHQLVEHKAKIAVLSARRQELFSQLRNTNYVKFFQQQVLQNWRGQRVSEVEFENLLNEALQKYIMNIEPFRSPR